MKSPTFKKIAALLLCFTLLMSSMVIAQESKSNISVTLNGSQLSFDVDPFIDDSNRTMVEARGISEALGAEISWDSDTQTVTILKGDSILKLVIGQSTYTINGITSTMDTAAIVINGRTMVPVRFVSEALGQDVAWDSDNNSVVLTAQLTSSFTIVTTGQSSSYDNDGLLITPVEGEDYYGQDADYASPAFSFTDNGNETVTDNNTGLMWQQIPSDDQMTYEEAVEYCENLVLGGYDDWRLPTSKEMFNLSDFSEGWPYLDQTYFSFPSASESGPNVGGGPQGGSPQGDDTSMPEGADKEAGAALLDSEDSEDSESTDMMPPPPSTEDTEDGSISKSQGQFWTDFYELGTTHEGATSAFGVNHATGHIKAYPADNEGMGKYVRAVRGDNIDNDFTDNSDGTITDESTGLMWMQADAGLALEWDEALAYAEDFEYGGYDDWRLPDVKELQSIVDYSGVYPAIDHSFFTFTELEDNEFYYYWTNTSAYFSTQLPDYGYAWYVAFGYAVDDEGNDTHGAGAVRFSPKYTDSSFVGEGGDNILNSIRLVRDVE
jgi:hypothetical protein